MDPAARKASIASSNSGGFNQSMVDKAANYIKVDTDKNDDNAVDDDEWGDDGDDVPVKPKIVPVTTPNLRPPVSVPLD